MAKARQQYFADEASIAKESREFAITPELLEKINSIEPWAQVNVIETVKVNWEALEPDDEKAVDVSVPLVEDTLYSTDTTAALSAKQWKVLYEYIQNISSRWRYLSNWNCVTWLAMTNPVDNPYNYMAWDYYVISVVAAQWGTNYRPNWSQYITWLASTTVETEIVKPWDYYTYDGTNWLLLINTAREIAVDSELSASSTNPVENRVVTWALNAKQNVITDLSTIRSGAAAWATALQPWDSLSQLTWDSDDITEGSTHLFMTTSERTKLSNQSWVNTWDETQTTIMSKLWAASSSTNWYLTSTDWSTFNGKQDAISDLSTIRDNATAGKSASDTIATYWDIVTHDANEFASASSWALADTAVQPWDNVSVLTNDAGYITDAYHDSTKQDKLIAWANIQIAADWVTISANDTTYVAWDFDIKDLADSQWKRAEWDAKQDALVAWNNIQIAADGKTISATDTTYSAWPGISISNNNVISAIDNKAVWWSIEWTLSNQTDLQSALDAKQDNLTAWTNIQIAKDGTISATDTTYTAGTWISIDANNVISNTQTSAEWWNISWTLSDQTDLQSALDAKQDDMVVLSYWNSTWQDFLDAYNKNAIVYCKASSQSNPWSWRQTRMAFMAFVDINATTWVIQGVEFQYYRSRSDHNSAANQLDEVYVYKLASNWTWSVTQRNTAAKATAWTWINLTYGSGNMTIDNTWVTSINSQTWDVTLTIPTVPTNVSDFVNDAWYITANDLPDVDTSMSDSSTNAVQNNVIKSYVDTQVQEATSGAVSDTSYSSAWNWITGIAPSKNAVYDKINAMDTTISGKQDTISDLSTIRSWASKWATAVQPWDNISTLTNDSGFITKAVNDLTNYYTKNEVYTKTEVDNKIANFAWFKVVATLPTTDIKTNIIYLLWPVGSWADRYEEYIYSNNAWIKIWETTVDLTPYFNKNTDTSDAITQGSTNLFLTTAERTKLSNTSWTNTGDETKTTIQTKLGAATSSNNWYLTSTDWSTFNSKVNTSDVLTKTNTTSYTPTANYHPATKKYVDDWLAWKQASLTAWENIEINSNVISANNLFIITESDVTVSTTDEYWVAPYNTSYYYTNIDINANAGIKWVEWAIYTFVVDTTMVVASANRNVRVKIWNWTYIPVMWTTTSLAGHSYFAKSQIRQFQYSTKYEAGWALHLFSDSNTTYSAMSVSEWKTGTATTARTVRADYLKQVIKYHSVDDTAYASSRDWKTDIAPSKNAVYDKISAMDTTIGNKANTSDLPSAMTASELNTWTSTTGRTVSAALLKAGITWAINARIDTTDYSSSWDWSTNAPTENAVYDKISAMDTTISGKANSSDVIKKTATSMQNCSVTWSWATTALALTSNTDTSYIALNWSNGFLWSYWVTSDKNPTFYNGSSHQLAYTSDIPTVNNGTLTITLNGTSKGTFTANQSGNSTIALTDTTYESKAAASGGTAVSLVTTWEKYTWNNKANTSDVLTKTNTTSYTPTANYHPATKKYVDDAVSQSSWWIQALPWSPIEIKYIWAWTQEQYDALSTYREDTIYHIV